MQNDLVIGGCLALHVYGIETAQKMVTFALKIFNSVLLEHVNLAIESAMEGSSLLDSRRGCKGHHSGMAGLLQQTLLHM